MARRGKRRAPPTPAQRRVMLIVGAALVFLACFVVLYEAVAWESGNLLGLVVVAVVLFLVFILPIITSLRHARRSRT